MLKSLLLPFLIFSLASYGFAESMKLSKQAEIAIITCGPTQTELYSAFGHSAIRVYDPDQGLDLVYNYGIFDFDQPNFYSNFAKGYLHYKLGVSRYAWFKAYYIKNNRFIHEQLLNLDWDQKQKLFDFLQWNAQPENQYYMYDYFYDNCATRVRDAVIKALGKENVDFDTSYFKEDMSIRDLTDLYLGGQPWGDFGIDLALGLPMDKQADGWIAMFLPDYLEQGFNNATILRNGKKEPIVKKTVITYKSTPTDTGFQLFAPLLITSALLILALVISFFDYRKNTRSKAFDVILFGFVGLAGLVFFLIWVATDHRAAANNFNLLWAIPLHLPVAVMLMRKENPGFITKYFLVNLILIILTLVLWFFLPQNLHYALIPLVLVLGLRSWMIFRVGR